MKRWLPIALMFFCCALSNVESAEMVETLSSKVILQNTSGYFVLSDKSLWKVFGFSKRWRSLSEWWNNVQLIPQNYECLPRDWLLGSQITVYSKNGNLEVDEANASNKDELKQCTHLLVNTSTGQVLFAMALEPADCIVKLFSDAHGDGYNKGYNEGLAKGNQNAQEIFERGHTEGYNVGFADGRLAAWRGDGWAEFGR